MMRAAVWKWGVCFWVVGERRERRGMCVRVCVSHSFRRSVCVCVCAVCAVNYRSLQPVLAREARHSVVMYSRP